MPNSSEDKSLASREALKSRISELYQKSIKENPSSLTAEHVTRLKSYLYEECPNKVLQLSKQCASTGIFSIDSLRTAIKKAEGEGTNAGPRVPSFTNPAEVAKYRELFQCEYSPYVACENDTLLLAKGTVPGNAAFGEIITKLLSEMDQLLWNLNECSFSLNLLQPPFGQEKSFDSKILGAIIGSVESVYASNRSRRAELVNAFRQRASDTVHLNANPQTTDTRHYLAHSEEETIADVATHALMLRNRYFIIPFLHCTFYILFIYFQLRPHALLCAQKLKSH